MTLSEFQTLALRTAKFPDDLADQYLEPGLSCEIWEVIGRRAKHVRDCGTDQNEVWTCAACREAMLLELGDVLWFAVVMLHRKGCRLLGCDGEHDNARFALTELGQLAMLGRRLDARQLQDVIWHVEEMACAMGSSLEEVMQMNVAKLEARHGITREVTTDREVLAELAKRLPPLVEGFRVVHRCLPGSPFSDKVQSLVEELAQLAQIAVLAAGEE